MQIKIFTVPIPGGEEINEEMNTFLRSKKVLQTESRLVQNSSGTFWCFCIRYLDEQFRKSGRKKVDYRQELDKESFQRFTGMRRIRKQLADKEGIPAFAVFTDKELAALARLTPLTSAAMRSVEGIGEKKVEKYGKYFVKAETTATSEADRQKTLFE